jgi:hypothetical protein
MRTWLRTLPYLAIGLLIVGIAIWSGQDLSGLWIIGSFAGVGLYLTWRRPREVVGWLLVAFALAFETIGNTLPGSASQVVDGRTAPWIVLVAWTYSWGAGLAFGTLVALAVLFPSGRFPTGRVGTIGRLAVATPVMFSIALAFAPTATVGFSDGRTVDVRLPFAIAPDWPGWPVIQVGVYIAVLTSLVAAIGTLIVRFRRARGPEREQFKWFLAAVAATVGTVVFAFAVLLLVDPIGTWMWWPAVFAYPLIPIAIGTAVLRYRLYEIDRIVSRTITWAVTTGLVAALFAVLIVGLQALLAPVTNQGTLVVAASTLAAAALFMPLYRRVQIVVDRRFNRTRYDGQRALEAFGTQLREEVELDAVSTHLVGVAARTVQPRAIGLWTRQGHLPG